MHMSTEMARERQQAMRAAAAAERQVQRVRALDRANRRAERAQRQLARSRLEATRLRVELAAEQGS
jgi:hypothetical protein